jgi:hypothetical protein
MNEIDGIEVDLSLLPEELQLITPLIRQYAVGDDVERTDLLEKAPTEDLRRLVDATESRWDGINAYLDENMDPPGPKQDVAIALDGFAQAAMEASSVLQARE